MSNLSPSPTALHELVEHIKEEWRAGSEPDAKKILENHSVLRGYSSFVVDLAYEEYCLKEERGNYPDTESFCKKFPIYQSRIRDVIQGHRLLADNPDLLANTPNWPKIGSEIEGLEILQELGRGAFARVYLASDSNTDRPVVLKLSATHSREAKTLGRLVHPNIISVYWSRIVHEMHCVCMPYVGSHTLREVIERVYEKDAKAARKGQAFLGSPNNLLPPCPVTVRNLFRANCPFADALSIVMMQIANALNYLHGHQNSVVHGDIKPSNILLGSGGQPYLIDFNLASAQANPLLRAAGTLPYMAPERLRAMLGQSGAASAPTPASDVYAFGITFFESLMGYVPLIPDPLFGPQASAQDLLTRRLEIPGSIAGHLPQIPRPLGHLIDRCLAIDPAKRPSFEAIQRELKRYTHRCRRKILGVVLPVVVALSAAAGIAYVAAPQEQEVVEREPTPPVTDEGRLLLGIRQARMDQIDEATNTLSDLIKERSVRNNPRLAGRTLAYLGYCQARKNRYTFAETTYEHAFSHGFDEAWVHHNLANVFLHYKTLPRMEQAQTEATKALERDPTLTVAHATRAISMARIWTLRPINDAERKQAYADVICSYQTGNYSAGDYFYLAAIAWESGDRTQKECQEITFTCLKRSIELGKQLHAISNDPFFGKSLQKHPQFDNLPKSSLLKSNAIGDDLRLTLPAVD